MAGRGMAVARASPDLTPGPVLGAFATGVEADFELAVEEQPHAVRRRLQAALDASDELFLDAAQLLLAQLVYEPETRFLYFDPDSRFDLQLFTWPAGFYNLPHFHSNWNVSAVMAGSLVIFRSDVSEAGCLNASPLIATAGQAGVLIPPQFHCLRNDGSQTAITFHVFSIDETPGDKLHLETSPTTGDFRLDDDGVLTLARAAALRGGARSTDIIRLAFAAASTPTKLDLVKLMARLNPPEAVHLGRTLSELVGGEDGRRLLAVVEKMELASR
jgi:hypothetical protein